MSVGYVERGPSHPLRPFVVCSWTRDTAGTGADALDRILPDGCIDIVWDERSLVVAGPDTRPVMIEPARNRRAARACGSVPAPRPAFLGVPSSELRDQRVPLDELWGVATTRRLTDRLVARRLDERRGV